MPILYGYSNHVLPKPQDWRDNHYVTGYWFLENERSWQPPQDLVQFIESSTPPIYFGFGSMIDKEIDTVIKIIVEALDKTHQRGIISGGWNELSELKLPSSIFLVNDIPHEWLFPQMVAVVHHGGAGTTAAGFKAGVPSIVVPFAFDQPFWGNIVYKLGVGPKPIPRKKLTVKKLANAINSVLDSTKYKENASILSNKINIENGVLRAVKVIENIINKSEY